MIIYCIVNKLNNKKYIGQTTKSITKRKWRHFNDPKSCLRDDLDKYGRDAFVFQIIENVEKKEDLKIREIAWIDRLGTMTPNGYNRNRNGWSHTKGVPKTEEWKKRMSKLKSGIPKPPHVQENLRKMSAERAEKMRMK